MKKSKRSSELTPKMVMAAVLIMLTGAVAMLAAIVLNQQPTQEIRTQAAKKATPITGSGAPSGQHYNLNLIGKDGKTCDNTQSNNGRRIFVSLFGKTAIGLTEADNFAVLDHCGNDGRAEFALPNPDPTNSGTTVYSVWAAPKGTPGGRAALKACADDVTSGETVCSTYQTVQIRNKGKNAFNDVSRELLYIYADLDGDGNLERYPLFDDALEGYFWDYDNNGLRLLQLRFYPVGSTVN